MNNEFMKFVGKKFLFLAIWAEVSYSLKQSYFQATKRGTNGHFCSAVNVSQSEIFTTGTPRQITKEIS